MTNRRGGARHGGNREASRVLIARRRDAADVAISNTFGANTLRGFKVRAEEVGE
jgi:hypothetical protein